MYIRVFCHIHDRTLYFTTSIIMHILCLQKKQKKNNNIFWWFTYIGIFILYHLMKYAFISCKIYSGLWLQKILEKIVHVSHRLLLLYFMVLLHLFWSMKVVNYCNCIFFSTEERKSYSFRMTWGRAMPLSFDYNCLQLLNINRFLMHFKTLKIISIFFFEIHQNGISRKQRYLSNNAYILEN